MNFMALRWLIHTELLLTVREPAAMFVLLILPLTTFLAWDSRSVVWRLRCPGIQASWNCFMCGMCCSRATLPG